MYKHTLRDIHVGHTSQTTACYTSSLNSLLKGHVLGINWHIRASCSTARHN